MYIHKYIHAHIHTVESRKNFINFRLGNGNPLTWDGQKLKTPAPIVPDFLRWSEHQYKMNMSGPPRQPFKAKS
jgi:hypothetical protein